MPPPWFLPKFSLNAHKATIAKMDASIRRSGVALEAKFPTEFNARYPKMILPPIVSIRRNLPT